MEDYYEERAERTRWFLHDRFGMFIHWGLYAIPSRGEWVLGAERMEQKDYRKFFEEFDPAEYRPGEWAKLAKEAGMRYAVLTAKHHDGFCLFDSKLTDYKSTKTQAGRDLVREYVEAFRREGLKVGLYYSLLDWRHPDYPGYGDLYHPDRDREEKKNSPHNFANYLKYLHGQVRELMTNYGKIDILWLDFSYGEMRGEKWRATELVRMIRRLQPDIILNSRLEGSGGDFGSIMTDAPSEISGDFSCPEMIIPARGLTTPSGRSVPWEACFTINNSWGYTAMDRDFKSAGMLVKKLVECVSKNGNLLLNVGPTASGEIPAEQVRVLREVGKWMRKNGESIYGCGASELPKPEWGRFTQRGETLYAHVLEESIGPICLEKMKGRLIEPRNLADGCEMHVVDDWIVDEFPEDLFLSYGADGVKTYVLPPTPDTVIRLQIASEKEGAK